MTGPEPPLADLFSTARAREADVDMGGRDVGNVLFSVLMHVWKLGYAAGRGEATRPHSGGGDLPDGMTVVVNHRAQPEAVLSPELMQKLIDRSLRRDPGRPR